ncbi:MAG: PhoH family protein [Pseudomonadota bacterium]
MTQIITFTNNHLLPVLFGVNNANLFQIGQRLDVHLASRGNQLAISGRSDKVTLARSIIKTLYKNLQMTDDLEPAQIDRLISRTMMKHDLDSIVQEAKKTNMAGKSPVFKKADHTPPKNVLALQIHKRLIKPVTQHQAEYLSMMAHHPITFAIGPAGTGKTWLGVAHGLSLLTNGLVKKMIITRPAVEAGENLGFLPGDMHNKLEPYLRPIDDACKELIGQTEMQKRREIGEIEIAPLAYMRGRTLDHAFVLMDEAQNTTLMQMKMFLTRLGHSSHMVITGDPSQADLPHRQKSGLAYAVEYLEHIKDIAIQRFSVKDVQRHHLVSQIIEAFEQTKNH